MKSNKKRTINKPHKKGSKKVYDGECKRQLQDKAVVGNLMIKCIPEYKDMSLDEAIKCIKYSDNSKTVKALQNEDNSMPNATIAYDLLLEADIPNKTPSISMYINVEAQNDSNPGYSLLNRAIYYSSRIISSQKNKDFYKSNYDGLKKVYSIWICTHPPKEKLDTINYYTIKEKCIKGKYKSKEDYKYINIIMLNVGENYDYENSKEVLEMCKQLFTNTGEKPEVVKRRLEKNYNIIRSVKEVSRMCNISEGIYNEGVQQGIEQGLQQGIEQGLQQGAFDAKVSIIAEMIKNGISKEIVFKTTKVDKQIIKEVNKILKKKEQEQQ